MREKPNQDKVERQLNDLSAATQEVKTISYVNLTILLVLLAFVIGVVLKQLGI